MSAPTSLSREFEDNALLREVLGPYNANLDSVARQLDVGLEARGNTVAITGPADKAHEADTILEALYTMAEQGRTIGPADIDAAVRMSHYVGARTQLSLRTRKKHIEPRSPVQAAYLEAMDRFEMVFGLGPAGTGKTYLAVAKAVSLMLKGEIDRLVLSRPAVEAGERLGFLPGDLRDKVDPYLRPLYDALHDMLPGDQVAKKLISGEIEVAPLAFMRGRTLTNSFVILDEAQNTTPVQMKMFLTRLGENSRMVITGDLSQIDLPSGVRSGLRDAVDVLEDVEGIGFVRFTDRDVVRHNLVTRIVRAYDAREKPHS